MLHKHQILRSGLEIEDLPRISSFTPAAILRSSVEIHSMFAQQDRLVMRDNSLQSVVGYLECPVAGNWADC